MPDSPEVPSPPTSPPPSSITAIAAPPQKSYKGMAITSWILIIFTGLLAIVPVLGYISLLMVWIVAPLVIIFAIIILMRRGTGQGIFLILLAILLVPWSFLAPTISTLLLGASISAQEQAQEKQIVANLAKIDSAKSQWAGETGAAAGATATMTDLNKYLGGQEVKVVVGETYDPRPVGQEAVAKLPARKSLASHKAGEEITAASANRPASPQESASPSAAATPTPEEEEE